MQRRRGCAAEENCGATMTAPRAIGHPHRTHSRTNAGTGAPSPSKAVEGKYHAGQQLLSPLV
jgi:hypothetical protein